MKEIFFNYTFQIVLLGSVLLGLLSGIVGTFSVFKNESLLTDAISHSSLAGISIVFILFNTKKVNFLLIGAFLIGIIIICFMDYVKKNTKIKEDSSMAILLSTFFGFGIVLLSYISTFPTSKKAGLNRFIFGEISTLSINDIKSLIFCSIFIFIFIILFYKEIKISIFDKNYAMTIGINSNIYNLLTSFFLVIIVILGIQISGAILITAFVISPSIASRMWTNKFHICLILSGLFGVISSGLGVLVSSLYTVPTGPIIVIILSVIVFFSLIFSKRGLVYKIYKRKKLKKEIIKRMEEV